MKKYYKLSVALLMCSMAFSQAGWIIPAHAALTPELPSEAVIVDATDPSSVWAFDDVSKTDPFYQEICAAREAGYVSGVGSNLLAAEAPMTVRDFLTILQRSFEIYSPLTSGEDIHSHTAIRMENYAGGVSDAIRAQDFFRALFYLFGVNPSKPVITGEMILEMAAGLDLIETGLSPDGTISRGDAIGAFMRMKEGGYQYIFEHFVGEIDMTAPDGINLNPYYGRLALVPTSVIQSFIEDGWKIVVTDQKINAGGIDAAGITDYSSKTIKVNQYDALVHEFGHYLDYKIGDASTVSSLYQAEKDIAAEVIRDYTKTNQREFFADSFAFWMEGLVISSNKGQMREKMPETYAYFQQLDKVYHFGRVYASTMELRPVFDEPLL